MRGTHTFRTLTGVVTAALVATSLGAAGSAVAEPTAAPAATSISIRALQSTVAPGKTGTIAGDLTVNGGSAAGRPVALEAQAAGEEGFTPVGTATAGERGGVRLAVQPAVNTRYRWHYAGADDARARVSGVVVVRVRTAQHPAHRLSTTLSVRAVRPVVAPGGSGVVRGTLRSGSVELRGRIVVLLARASGQESWQFRKVQRTGRAGGVSFRVRPQVRTAFRLAFAGTGTFRPAKSGVVHVGVRPAVKVALAPKRVDPGQSTVVSGTVVRSDSPVADAVVDLYARPAGSKRFAAIANATTAADGSVSITTTPAKDTQYRLHVRSASGLPSGWSRVVAVDVRNPSSLSIRGRDTAEGLAISGQLRAKGKAVRNAVVKLQTYDAATSAWTDTATARTGSNGVVRFVRPAAPGTSYRLSYEGTRFARSASATLTD